MRRPPPRDGRIVTASSGCRKRSKTARASVAEAGVLGGAEGDQQAERLDQRLGQAREPLGQHRVELGQREPVERLAAEVDDRLDRRDHLVAARLGEQRGVVAGAEIDAVAAQVDDPHRAGAEVLRPGDVDARQPDQLAERFRDRPRAAARSGRLASASVASRLLRMTAARSLDRPYLAISSNSRRRIGMLTRSMLVTWAEEI